MTASSTATTPTILDEVVPDKRFADAISIEIVASPEAIFKAFREVTVKDMPIAAVLGELRYLPGRLLGRGQPEAPVGESFVEGIEKAGWVTIGAIPGKEFVFGGAGKYHQLLDQEPFALHDREEFIIFNRPEYQKLAISVRVEAGSRPGINRFVMEHRTQALSEESARKFARYWFFIKPSGAFVSRQLLKAVKRLAEAETTR